MGTTTATEKKANFRLELVEKMTTLATGGLGFVAGLAWNDAIQSAFQMLFPETGSLIAKFVYAIIITVVIVLLTMQLSRMANVLKQQLDKTS